MKFLYIMMVLLSLGYGVNMFVLLPMAIKQERKKFEEDMKNKYKDNVITTVATDRVPSDFKELAEKYDVDYNFLVAYAYMESGLNPRYTTDKGYGIMCVELPVTNTYVNIEYFIKKNDCFKDIGYMEFLKKHKTIDYIQSFNNIYKFLNKTELQ